MGHFAQKFVRNEYFAILADILGIFLKWGLKGNLMNIISFIVKENITYDHYSHAKNIERGWQLPYQQKRKLRRYGVILWIVWI